MATGKSITDANTPVSSSADDIDNFLKTVRTMQPVATSTGKRGRLIFAMDATMSRQPAWDTAQHIQAQMFDETARIGGLDVQLVYFRGISECKASRWTSDARVLGAMMSKIDCRGGHTQIAKVLKHVLKQSTGKGVSAVVYVGDCMEENIDTLCQLAGKIALTGTRIFMFQEGSDPLAYTAFREISRLTGGACCRFSTSSPAKLRDLLTAVAVYAAGGRKALAEYAAAGGQGARLLEQMK